MVSPAKIKVVVADSNYHSLADVFALQPKGLPVVLADFWNGCRCRRPSKKPDSNRQIRCKIGYCQRH